MLLDTDEYVEPSVHGAHVTSDVALPATDTPCPAGHFDHGVHVAYDADEAIHAPLPWYPVLHVQDDLSLEITPYAHDTAVHAG